MGQGQPLGGTHIPKISLASPWGKGLALMQEAPLQIPACQMYSDGAQKHLEAGAVSGFE